MGLATHGCMEPQSTIRMIGEWHERQASYNATATERKEWVWAGILYKVHPTALELTNSLPLPNQHIPQSYPTCAATTKPYQLVLHLQSPPSFTSPCLSPVHIPFQSTMTTLWPLLSVRGTIQPGRTMAGSSSPKSPLL